MVAPHAVDGRPLDIWLVSQSYLPYHGGITEHVWHLAGGLASRGHRVTILTGTPLHAGTAPEADPPGVRVLRWGRTVRLPSHGGRACVVLDPACAGRRWPQTIAPPDLVHIQSPLEPFLPLWALRSLPGAKIGTFHTGGSRLHWGYRGFGRWLGSYAGRLDRRIAVSREALRFVAGCFPHHYEIIPNGIDLARFRPAPARPAARPAVVLHVGRLDPRKGLRDVLVAFAQLEGLRRVRGGCPIELWIAGAGPEGRWLARESTRRRLPVRLLGEVPRDELPHLYRAADLFVAASVDGESFGIHLLEAMASGVPILATRIAGYAETLSDSGAARWVCPGRVDELSAGMAALLADPSARARMGAAGRRHAGRFDWERVVPRVERVYREALGRPRITGGSDGRS